uniref:Uncharacterized protein n=1 Tax=Mesocestoides corti TaxID=53468 RepID=A0A5K3FPA1_MESCO
MTLHKIKFGTPSFRRDWNFLQRRKRIHTYTELINKTSTLPITRYLDVLLEEPPPPPQPPPPASCGPFTYFADRQQTDTISALTRVAFIDVHVSTTAATAPQRIVHRQASTRQTHAENTLPRDY